MITALALLAAGTGEAVVLKPAANMYAQPTVDSEVVSQAIYGSNIGILEERSGWAHVRTADDYKGWMEASSFRRLKPGEGRYAMGGNVVDISSLFANIYRERDATTHQPLMTVPFETKLEVMVESERQERWIQIRLADGRAGWVQRGDVAADTKRLDAAQTIALADWFVGLPYLWGGTSTFGFDCSGFTQMLCRRRGVVMPRDADLQARWSGSIPVDRNALEPGDLLFFGETKVNHTGMYMGNGKFINATTHGRPMVQISDLGDPHWAKLFREARRVK